MDENKFEQKIEDAVVKFNKMEDKKISDPQNGLAVQLENLEKMKKDLEDNFKSEFPGLNIDATKPIPFRTPEDQIMYEDMQKEHMKLKKGIFELETTINLIQNREEN